MSRTEWPQFFNNALNGTKFVSNIELLLFFSRFGLSSFPVVINPTLSGLTTGKDELPEPISIAKSEILIRCPFSNKRSPFLKSSPLFLILFSL